MKFLSILTAMFLPLAVITTPVPESNDVAVLKALAIQNSPAKSAVEARDAEAEAVGLVDRNGSTGWWSCDIVGVSTTVNCRLRPRTNSAVVKKVPGTTNNISFFCYSNCENIEGNTSWDWTGDWGDGGCYISGHYTDSTCSRANLGPCPWNDC
ncbi:hypothetical protein BKA61DRAFT_741779 [Leptodontidium sp. MPI-SDFR-AT-0119]|nr:hypothetical protein BKA61DRAFT_741779 [Leptodontidium sp. MPI-SDFR-AT-0119]